MISQVTVCEQVAHSNKPNSPALKHLSIFEINVLLFWATNSTFNSLVFPAAAGECCRINHSKYSNMATCLLVVWVNCLLKCLSEQLYWENNDNVAFSCSATAPNGKIHYHVLLAELWQEAKDNYISAVMDHLQVSANLFFGKTVGSNVKYSWFVE